jgi:fibronectin-binding autotransporter adhesin
MKALMKWLLVIVLLSCSPMAWAQPGVLPTGYIGAVQCCNTPGQYSTYTYSFTPTQSGSDFVLFAFRQDPAYWSFGNVQVTLPGSASNLVINGNMQYGGGVTVSTNSGDQYIQAPTHWGVVYQSGIYPAAAGTWSGGGGPQGVGQWYDGAVGSFDGIYQGISVTAGQTYTVSFQALSTYGVANTSSIQIGVYAGGCANLGMSPANCQPNSNSGFTSLATPAQTGTAGGVTVTSTTTTNVTSTVTSTGTPVVTTTYPTRTVNAVVNGQAVIETFVDTQTSTVTPTITTTYSTPTTTTTYSDGTTVISTGNPIVTSTTTVQSAPVIAIINATTPTSIVPAYASNITPAQQARYNSSQAALMSIGHNGIYINNLGSNNQINVQQVGTQNQVSGNGSTFAQLQGNSNTISVTQGDVIARSSPNLLEMSVTGDYNDIHSNQGVLADGTSTGTDLGYHYQSIQVNGNSNKVSVTQVGYNHYAESNVNGNNNSVSISQVGNKQQAFTNVVGDGNLLALSQSGSQNYADVSVNGPSNSVNLLQTGNSANKATISLTNAGSPSSVAVTQSGGQVYSISQTCVSSCGTVTIHQ